MPGFETRRRSQGVATRKLIRPQTPGKESLFGPLDGAFPRHLDPYRNARTALAPPGRSTHRSPKAWSPARAHSDVRSGGLPI